MQAKSSPSATNVGLALSQQLETLEQPGQTPVLCLAGSNRKSRLLIKHSALLELPAQLAILMHDKCMDPLASLGRKVERQLNDLELCGHKLSQLLMMTRIWVKPWVIGLWQAETGSGKRNRTAAARVACLCTLRTPPSQ